MNNDKIKKIIDDKSNFDLLSKTIFDDLDTESKGYLDFYNFQKLLNEASNELYLEKPNKNELNELIKSLNMQKKDSMDYKDFQNLLKQSVEMLSLVKKEYE